MAIDTYVLLSKVTLGVNASSITFSNIPQTGYSDLVLKCSVRNGSGTSQVDGMQMAFNGSTASFTTRYLESDGGSLYTGTLTNYAALENGASSTANTFSSTEFYIPNYTSNLYKSFSIDAVSENNAAAGYRSSRRT